MWLEIWDVSNYQSFVTYVDLTIVHDSRKSINLDRSSNLRAWNYKLWERIDLVVLVEQDKLAQNRVNLIITRVSLPVVARVKPTTTLLDKLVQLPLISALLLQQCLYFIFFLYFKESLEQDLDSF